MAEAGLRNSWSMNSSTWEPRPKPDYQLASDKSNDMKTQSIRKSGQKSFPPGVTNKILALRDRLSSARLECLELRQEASDLQEYSSVKITRASRYLGVLSEKARKLDQVAVEWEARVTPLKNERKKLLNKLLAGKGNGQVFCRVRPEFEEEGEVITSFPNDSMIRLRIPPSGKSGPTEKQFEFDRVYAPHVGQEEIFNDVQPTIQSALDGNNVSIFAYGQSGAGKTYTLEGTSGDPGIILRAVEELFHLSSADASPAARTIFHMTMVELHDDKVRDLLSNAPGSDRPTAVEMGDASQLKLVGEKIDNVRDFARYFDNGARKRMGDNYSYQQSGSSVLLLTIHIQYVNTLLREKYHSKVSFVDMPASDDHLNVEASLAALGDVLAAVAAKDEPPYGNSLLTSVLADSVGGDAKTVVIVNVCPCAMDLAETLASVSFGVHARNKPKSIEEDKGGEMSSEKLSELARLEEENARLEKSLKEADSQCVILLNALQKASEEEKSKEVEKAVAKTPAQEEELTKAKQAIGETAALNKRLEEELSKRDELIERLHEENEKLFERLTAKPTEAPAKESERGDAKDSSENGSSRPPAERGQESTSGTMVTTGSSAVLNVKSTPAGEYLSAALLDFNPDQYDSPAAVVDGANKLLMLVLAAVIKAGAAREHEMLAEIRDAVFTFIRKMESRAAMDTMLVSRVRILYIRSLCSRSSELQSIQLPPVERFLERAGGGGSLTRKPSSREDSPARSPLANSKLFHSKSGLDDNVPRFKVNLGSEKKSKLSSFFGKFRVNDQLGSPQPVTGGRLRETSDEARKFAVGNKALAALFVHTPAGELQRQIRSWLTQNFDPLAGVSSDGVVEGQLELLSTAIMDGWMSGLGVPQRPSTDALGQLLSDYTKLVYSTELQHLKDIAATLATEEADDIPQVAQLRSGLESVEHKRRKVMQQMRSDVALLTKEEGGSPFRTPSSANEDARVASLVSLEDILKQAEEIVRDARGKPPSNALKKSLISRMSTLSERMPTLLPIDYTCAQKSIAEVQKAVDSIQEFGNHHHLTRQGSIDAEAMSDKSEDVDGDVVQWSVLQFNNGTSTPLVIKCGATPTLELVVKAVAKLGDKSSKEIVAVVPAPSALNGLSLEEIKQILSRVPEAFSNLAMARTADGIRARYSRLYKTLGIRVPALRSIVSADSEPIRDQGVQTKWQTHGRRRSEADEFAPGDVH
ncbi:unnamed protein product [Calypogeia fissa]